MRIDHSKSGASGSLRPHLRFYQALSDNTTPRCKSNTIYTASSVPLFISSRVTFLSGRQHVKPSHRTCPRGALHSLRSRIRTKILTLSQGNVYSQIIDRIITDSKDDFEAAGLDQETLQELKQVSRILRRSGRKTCAQAVLSNHYISFPSSSSKNFQWVGRLFCWLKSQDIG